MKIDTLNTRIIRFKVKGNDDRTLVLHRLAVNAVYSIYSEAGKWVRDVRFIQVSAKGYNLLNVATGKCVLPKTTAKCSEKILTAEELAKMSAESVWLLLPQMGIVKRQNQQ